MDKAFYIQSPISRFLFRCRNRTSTPGNAAHGGRLLSLIGKKLYLHVCIIKSRGTRDGMTQRGTGLVRNMRRLRNDFFPSFILTRFDSEVLTPVTVLAHEIMRSDFRASYSVFAAGTGIDLLFSVYLRFVGKFTTFSDIYVELQIMALKE
ncbi:hypothetical protein YC2023_116350 [Brassica napus]